MEAKGQAVYDVQISKPEAVKLIADERERLSVVGRPHAIIWPVRRKANADAVGEKYAPTVLFRAVA